MLLLLLLPLSHACRSDSCTDPAPASLAAASETLGFQDSGINKLGVRLVAVFLPLVVCCSLHLLYLSCANGELWLFLIFFTLLPLPHPHLWHFLNSSWLFCKGCHLKHPTVLIKLLYSSSLQVTTALSQSQLPPSLYLRTAFVCVSISVGYSHPVHSLIILLLILSGWNHTKLCNQHMLSNK